MDTWVLSLTRMVGALKQVVRPTIVNVTPETSPIHAILPNTRALSFPTTPTDLKLAEIAPGSRPLPALPCELPGRRFTAIPPGKLLGLDLDPPGGSVPSPKSERVVQFSPILTVLSLSEDSAPRPNAKRKRFKEAYYMLIGEDGNKGAIRRKVRGSMACCCSSR